MEGELTREGFSKLTAMLVKDINFNPEIERDILALHYAEPILVENMDLLGGIYDWRIKEGGRFVAKIIGASPNGAWEVIKKYGLIATDDIEVYAATHKAKQTQSSYKRHLLLAGVEAGDI